MRKTPCIKFKLGQRRGESDETGCVSRASLRLTCAGLVNSLFYDDAVPFQNMLICDSLLRIRWNLPPQKSGSDMFVAGTTVIVWSSALFSKADLGI